MPHLSAPFPATRFRRLRQNPALRALVRETHLGPSDFIWPVFVMEGRDAETAIPSMPGVTRKTPDRIARAAREEYREELNENLKDLVTETQEAIKRKHEQA